MDKLICHAFTTNTALHVRFSTPVLCTEGRTIFGLPVIIYFPKVNMYAVDRTLSEVNKMVFFEDPDRKSVV